MFLDHNTRFVTLDRRSLFLGKRESDLEEMLSYREEVKALGLGDAIISNYTSFYKEAAAWTLGGSVLAKNGLESKRRNLPVTLAVLASIVGITRKLEAGEIMKLTTSAGNEVDFEYLGYRQQYKGKTDVFALKYNGKVLYCTLDQFAASAQQKLKLKAGLITPQVNEGAETGVDKIQLLEPMKRGNPAENPTPEKLKKLNDFLTPAMGPKLAADFSNLQPSVSPESPYLPGRNIEEVAKSFPIKLEIKTEQFSLYRYRIFIPPDKQDNRFRVMRDWENSIAGQRIREHILYAENNEFREAIWVLNNRFDRILEVSTKARKDMDMMEELQTCHDAVLTELEARFTRVSEIGQFTYGPRELGDKCTRFDDGLGHSFLLYNVEGKSKDRKKKGEGVYLHMISSAEADTGGKFKTPNRNELENYHKKHRQWTEFSDGREAEGDIINMGLASGNQGSARLCATATLGQAATYGQEYRPQYDGRIARSIALETGTSATGGTTNSEFEAAAEELAKDASAIKYKKLKGIEDGSIHKQVQNGTPVIWSMSTEVEGFAATYTAERMKKAPVDNDPETYVKSAEWEPESHKRFLRYVTDKQKEQEFEGPDFANNGHFVTIVGSNAETDEIAFSNADGTGRIYWIPMKIAKMYSQERVWAVGPM